MQSGKLSGRIAGMRKTQEGTRGAARPHPRPKGRPQAEHPKVVMSIRFNRDLVTALDAWARANGDIGRSAAIRQAVARMVQKESEK